jgi:hypothetical protein
VYEVTANAACEIDLPAAKFAKGIEYSSDGLKWAKLAAAKNGDMLVATIDEAALGTGTLLLRAAGR